MADHEQEPLTHLDIATVIDVIGKLESMEETLWYWTLRIEMYGDQEYLTRDKVLSLVKDLREAVRDTKRKLELY
jgi:hypothetical protein